MDHMRRLLMLLLLAAATCVFAAEVRPGDHVRLIEREQHIPAHPTPGDTRVYLRLVSGSEAMVLRVDTNTGWVEVRGFGSPAALRRRSSCTPSGGRCA
jgi:hypothetical protein